MKATEVVITEVITDRISRRANRRAHFRPPKDTIRFWVRQEMGLTRLNSLVGSLTAD
jgi:hypothetical protein